MSKKRTMYPCVTCGQNMTQRKGSQCHVCYHKSPQFRERMAQQAKSANKRANEVRWGYKKIDWEFDVMSPELAFVIGAYLTDGWISRVSGKGKIMGFAISGTYPEFMEHLYACLIEIGASPKRNKPRQPTGLKTKVAYRVVSLSQNLGQWLYVHCEGKNKIPSELRDSTLECRVSFLAGLIDGDGCIDTSGTITVYGSKGYMKMLPELLDSCEIETRGWRLIKILPSGKEMARVSVNRSDFIRAGGWCSVARKQERLLHPVYRTPKYHPCPVCGKNTMSSTKLKSCKTCFLSSQEHIDHLRRISPLGNAAHKK